MPAARRRILLAVDPFVLASALGGLLAEAGQDDVVVLDLRESPKREASAAARSGHFDAAVVTHASYEAIDADVVIELPDEEGSAGTVTVRHADGRADRARVDGVIDLVALLDEACAAPQPRASRLNPDR